MSISIKGASFKSKKYEETNINFNALEGEYVNMITTSKEETKFIKTLLSGKYDLSEGEYKIDNFDRVNKRWTLNKISIIKPESPFLKLVPSKWILFFSLLLNKEFYKISKHNYVEQKYNYLIYRHSNGNETIINLQNQIESIVQNLIDASIKMERIWLNEFLENIVNYNNNQIDSYNKDLDSNLIILIKKYFLTYEENENRELMLTFLQSLWDKIYSFIDLRSSCNCEYKAAAEKKRKLVKHLIFNEHKYVITKYLKIINIKIRNLKLQIWQNNFSANLLKNKIKLELLKKKGNKKILKKKFDNYFEWKKLSDDQRLEFISKQENLIFKTLADEGATLRGKIIEIVHNYHKDVFNYSINWVDRGIFASKKKKLKTKINSISKQAITWTNDMKEKLKMKFHWVSKPWKITTLNWIYVQLLRQIFLGKKNIIFANVTNSLTVDEAEELKIVIESIEQEYKDMTFVNVNTKLNKLIYLDKDIYGVNNNELSKINFFNNNESGRYIFNILSGSNKMYYSKKDSWIFINNEKFERYVDQPEAGFAVINPFRIHTNKKETDGKYVSKLLRIRNTKFLDRNLYRAIDKNGAKFMFYSKNNYKKNDQVEIYFDSNSIEKYVGAKHG